MPITRDLHDGFREPRSADAGQLSAFLREADRLPGVQPLHRAMRRALAVEPGTRILDAGCGIGLEARRLAVAHPGAHVTGLDRNRELLHIARTSAPQPANLRWLEMDLTERERASASFDAIRTERVLMYLPGSAFERVLGELVRLLRSGGRLVLFELDYGATILPPGHAGDEAVAHINAALDASLPQPRAGRRIPRLLSDRGLTGVTATPMSFAVTEPIWRRIVHDTLLTRAGERLDNTVAAWLEEHAAVAAAGGFVAAFTGILTTARHPG
jgi:SAM-dependent methyltransferase